MVIVFLWVGLLQSCIQVHSPPAFTSGIHLRQDGQQDLGTGVRRLRKERDLEALEAIQETGHGQVGPLQLGPSKGKNIPLFGPS